MLYLKKILNNVLKVIVLEKVSLFQNNYGNFGNDLELYKKLKCSKYNVFLFLLLYFYQMMY